jgi:hypothetical protein
MLVQALFSVRLTPNATLAGLSRTEQNRTEQELRTVEVERFSNIRLLGLSASGSAQEDNGFVIRVSMSRRGS